MPQTAEGCLFQSSKVCQGRLGYYVFGSDVLKAKETDCAVVRSVLGICTMWAYFLFPIQFAGGNSAFSGQRIPNAEFFLKDGFTVSVSNF